MKSQQALTCEGESDYLLDWDSVWITVGNLSVCVVKEKEGVCINVWPHYAEMDDSLGELQVPYCDFPETQYSEEEE